MIPARRQHFVNALSDKSDAHLAGRPLFGIRLQEAFDEVLRIIAHVAPVARVENHFLVPALFDEVAHRLAPERGVTAE